MRDPEIGPVEAVAIVRVVNGEVLAELAAREKATFRAAEAWLGRRLDRFTAPFTVLLFPPETRPWGLETRVRRSTPALRALISEMRCFGTVDR